MLPHLIKLGYPAHWISNCLLNIISNTVTTTARPPRKLPMTVADVQQRYPNANISTAPFANEASTLTQIFAPLLTFTIPSALLPAKEDIFNYKFHFPTYLDEEHRENCLSLIFWNKALLPDKNSAGDIRGGIRQFLVSTWGEVDKRFQKTDIDKFREKGVVVWSVFKFDIENKVVSVRLPKSLMERLAQEKWVVGVWRSDSWTMNVRNPVPVGEGAQGTSWVGESVQAAMENLTV